MILKKNIQFFLAWRGRVWCVRRLRGVVCGLDGEAGPPPPPALAHLPQLLHAQYEHEEPALRIGTHLMHTHYLKVFNRLRVEHTYLKSS